MLLESIDLAWWYYIGVVCGLVFMMVYQYWLKYKSEPQPFDKKYLVPFLVSLIVAVLQLVLEIAGMPVPVDLTDPLQAFYTGFIFWAGVQEILKVILKLPQIDYFNTA